MICATTTCSKKHVRKWCSQPIANNKPLGNVLLCSAILFTGSSPTKVIRLLSVMGVQSLQKTQYFQYQRCYLLPPVQQVCTFNYLIRVRNNSCSEVVISEVMFNTCIVFVVMEMYMVNMPLTTVTFFAQFSYTHCLLYTQWHWWMLELIYSICSIIYILLLDGSQHLISCHVYTLSSVHTYDFYIFSCLCSTWLTIFFRGEAS